jgi:hypothetical protein
MKTIVLGLLTLAAGACGSIETVNSDQVSKETIYRSYNADFSQETKELRLSAQFRVGGAMGTTLRLKDPSRVTVESDSLELNDGDKNSFNLIGTFYSKTEKVDAPQPSYRFVWTSDDKKELTNVLEMPTPATISKIEKGAKISRSKSFNIAFKSDDLEENEEVVAYIKSDVKNVKEDESSLIIETTKSGKRIGISADDLGEMPLGPAKIHLEKNRWQKINSSKENSGGDISSSIVSESTLVEIVK